ncbi:uncharacterized protein Fot_00279 [Forsythia ovata]|uniref:Uncharacterized protein n=1 Tax=Forsythia ovata TaxID=205694 RepID=A0ABD1X0Q9_9LAMI
MTTIRKEIFDWVTELASWINRFTEDIDIFELEFEKRDHSPTAATSGGNPTPFAAQLPHFPKNTTPTLQNSDDVVELPLVSPATCSFSGGYTSLYRFSKFRYRMMMHTLLQTDLRFGVIYTNSASGTAEVGCVGEVIKHERLVDDRFFLICKGQKR